MKTYSWLALVVVTLGVGLAASAQSPAIAEAQKTFDAGDYKGTLSKIAAAMSLKQSALAAEDNYALLMLKGESLLRLNERGYAVDSFNAAMRAAGRENIKKAALAKANAVLIRLSQGSAYRPATGNGEGISILTPETRVKAMGAAFDDLYALNMPKMKRAQEGAQLPPMLDLVPILGDLFVLETAAAGEATKTTGVLKSFGAHARSLMAKELTIASKRIQQLQALENSVVATDNGFGTNLDRRGLWNPERRELEDLIAYLRKIRQTAQKARTIAQNFGFTGENWDGTIAECVEILDHADEVWEHRQ